MILLCNNPIRIEKSLGWKSKISIEDGLKKQFIVICNTDYRKIPN